MTIAKACLSGYNQLSILVTVIWKIIPKNYCKVFYFHNFLDSLKQALLGDM